MLSVPFLPFPFCLSVTEGEDKPLKYPTIFNTADVAVITKTGLAAAVEFAAAAAHRSIQAVRPGMRVFEVSAKTGAGLDAWVRFLQESARPGSATHIPPNWFQNEGEPGAKAPGVQTHPILPTQVLYLQLLEATATTSH